MSCVGFSEHSATRRSCEDTLDARNRDRLRDCIRLRRKKALNTGLQVIRNYSVRKTFLEKLSEHTDSFIADLDQLDPLDTTKVNHLSDDVIKYRDSMANCMYQSELGYAGSFRELPDEMKLHSTRKSSEISEKAIYLIRQIILAKQAWDFWFLYMAGMMVWDIFTSNHQILVAVRTTVDYLTYLGTTALSDVVKAITSSALTEAGFYMVDGLAFAAGVVAGIAGAFIIGAVIGPLLALFLGTGGELDTTTGIKCHIAELPDGATLANQIWSEDQQK
ncbi:hypothetical protein OROMI_011182 [Orobanche minor]